MKVIKYADILSTENVETIREVIADNGVLVYPTDTLYGLGGNFLSTQVMTAIDAIKERSDMPYSAAVADRWMLETLVESIPPVFDEIYEKLLPGKFTFLFKAAPSLDKSLLKGSEKIGIRIPDVPNILELIKILDTPLISTSVNRSGQPALNDPKEITSAFPKGISLLIDNGPLPESQGSTILDLTTDPVKLIRKGSSFQQLKTRGLFDPAARGANDTHL